MSIEGSTDTEASLTKTPPLHAPTQPWHGDVIEIDDDERPGPTDELDDESVSRCCGIAGINLVDLVLTM